MQAFIGGGEYLWMPVSFSVLKGNRGHGAAFTAADQPRPRFLCLHLQYAFGYFNRQADIGLQAQLLPRVRHFENIRIGTLLQNLRFFQVQAERKRFRVKGFLLAKQVQDSPGIVKTDQFRREAAVGE